MVKHIESQNVILDDMVRFIERKIDETSDKHSVNLENFQKKLKLLALERNNRYLIPPDKR